MYPHHINLQYTMALKDASPNIDIIQCLGRSIFSGYLNRCYPVASFFLIQTNGDIVILLI